MDTALGGALEDRGQRASGGLRGLSLSVWLPPVAVSLCVFVRCLSLRFSHCLSQPLSSSLTLSLGSSPLREMSVGDKDTRKNPGRVGRKRGQGHKDS